MDNINKKQVMTDYEYRNIIKMIDIYSRGKNYDKQITKRLKKIVEKENSFILGMTETFSNNLDYIFRYLYLIGLTLMIAGQFVI
jgi:hypothetical protein